jgi:autotransporter-associated beta strand protein
MRPSKPLRRVLATLALGLAGFVGTAKATLQVYEGFDYTVPTRPTYDTLHGKTGGTGFDAASSWIAGHTNSYPAASPAGFAICNAASETKWNGTLTSLPQTGNYAGSAAPAAASPQVWNGNSPDHLYAYRLLHPDVTSSFTIGATTWMSFAQATNFTNNGNGLGCSLAIGAGHLGTDAGEDRGYVAYGGGAIGIGLDYNGKFFKAAVWGGGNAGGNMAGTTSATINSQSTTPRILIAKIVWGDASNPTTIYQATFLDGAALTETAFNTAAVSYSATFDPSTYNKLAIGGARMSIDELRVGTTFDDAVGVVAVSNGKYWAPVAGGGGAGTWSAAGTVWAGVPSALGTLGQSTTERLVFVGTAGEVMIDGTVTVPLGIDFNVTDYILSGSSPANLSLTGANAADNTLSVTTGTTTISAEVSGSNGLTKDGSGRLVLSGTGNTYSGGTMLNAGTLQIAALGSLGSDVTFGGGTLQYPTGSGTSTIDVSTKIPTVASPQIAKIDTNGFDVTFGTAIGGDGSLTKLGAGSLTLAAAVPTGPTTASGGTLNVSSASGTIATLNVPAGGTVNLGAGATITTLNLTGGTVNITGAGVLINTLVATSGVFDASSFALTVSGSAVLGQTKVTLTGGTSFTLEGVDLVTPTSVGHRTITASSGTLAFTTTGLDAAIGISQPGTPALPTTATFGGSGVWTLNGGAAIEFGNFYGQDNHAFHYMQVASGDFDISVHVTTATNAEVGLMARDSLAASSGDWAGIWTGRSANMLNGVLSQGAGPGGNRWFRIARVGNLVTSYHGPDGTAWTQAQQLDCSSHPWGPTTYLGLGLANTSGPLGSAVGGYDNVNFMGTATLPDLSYTELDLSGGAFADVPCFLQLGKLTIDSIVKPDGSYTAANTPLSISGAGSIQIGPVVTTTDYDTWAASYLPDIVTDPAADLDGDGLTNQQEYAFGLNPTLGSSINPITQQLDKATGIFQYTRRATPTTTGLTYKVYYSTDLSDWLWDEFAAQSAATPVDGVETVTVTLAAAAPSGGRLFIRVEATQP